MPIRNFENITNASQFIQVLATDGLTDEVRAAYTSFPLDTQENLAKTLLQDYPSAASELGVVAEVPEPEPLVDDGQGDTAPLVEPLVEPLKGKLPDDFPGHAALADAGINTYAQLRKAGDVTEIPGIGPATAAKINEALGGN